MKTEAILVTAILVMFVLFCVVGIPLLAAYSSNKTQPAESSEPFKRSKKTRRVKNKPTDLSRFEIVHQFKKLSESTGFDPNVQFGNPVSLKDPSKTSFGSAAFVHDVGFIAILTQTGTGTSITQSFSFYQLVGESTLVKLNEIPLPTTLVTVSRPGYFVTATFFPSLNVFEEIYYFAITMGEYPSPPIPLYGREIILCYYDTSSAPGSKIWTLQPLFLMTHPLFSSYLQTAPWVGCFGQQIQAVTNQTAASNTHSLYANSTDTSSTIFVKNAVTNRTNIVSEGGSIFWFIFTTNTRNPLYKLQLNIKDAKLQTLAVGGGTALPVSGAFNESEYYMLGFGTRFHVSSDNAVNLLAVVNQTDQDSLKVSCLGNGNDADPTGYVQVYVESDSGWSQNNLTNCTNDPAAVPGQRIFTTRYSLHPTNKTDPDAVGIGAGLLFFGQYLIVNFESQNPSVSTGRNNFAVTYAVTSYDQSPTLDSQILGKLDYNQFGISSSPFLLPWGGHSMNYVNRALLNVNNDLLVGTYSDSKSVNTIAIFATANSARLPGVTPIINPFANFDTPKQLFGADITVDSQTVVVNNGKSVTFANFATYGSHIATWYTLSRLTVNLLINDGAGQQVWLYQKNAN